MIALTGQWLPPRYPAAGTPAAGTPAAGAKVSYTPTPAGRNGAPGQAIDVHPDSPVAWHMLTQVVPAGPPGSIYRFACWVHTENVKGGAGAYLSLNAFAANEPKRRLTYQDSGRASGNEDWLFLETVLLVPEGANELSLILVLNGTGRAVFSQPELERVSENQPLGPEVTVTVGREPIRKDFLGFGFEDDPFFFTASNTLNGVDPVEDGALRERRIRELNPAVVRSFLFWDAFNPKHDLQTITWRTEMADSLYRTLDLYQQMGVAVNITGAFWGWGTNDFPFNNERLERGVQVYVQALKHLVQEKGYTCIRYVTVINEPDLCWKESGGTFDTWLRAHHRLREELDKAGLKSLILVGADVAGSPAWLERTIAGSDDCLGIYAMHKYLNTTQYPLIDYHLAQAKNLIAAGSANPDKPLFLWEFGHVGNEYTATSNAEVGNYQYGLLSAYNCIALMNQGLVGGSFWCLHSLYYLDHIGDKMEFGLWDYKDKGWSIRPAYYAFGLFSRFFRPGSTPVEVTQEPENNRFVTAAMRDPAGGITLYLLNMSDGKVTARLGNLPPRKYAIYRYAEGRLPAADSPNYERIDALLASEPWDATTGGIEVEPRSLLVLK